MKTTLTLLFVISMLSSPTAVGEEESPPAAKEVGVILPLSGELVSFGEKVRLGIELGAQRYAGDIKLVFEDGEASKSKALSAYQKLAALNGIRFFIGPFGPDQTFVVASPAKKHDSLFVSVSLCDERFKKLANVFCLYPSQHEQIAPLISHFIKNFAGKIQRIALLLEEVEAAAPFFESVTDYSKRSAAKIVSAVRFPHDTSDFRAYLLKIKTSRPDLLIVGALSPATVVQAFRQAKEVGLEAPFRWYLSEHDTRFFHENREILEDAYTTGMPELDARFSESFRASSGLEPDLYHALGYEAARALLTALRSTGFSPNIAQVADTMITFRDAAPAIHGFHFSTERFVSMLLKPKQFRGGVLEEIRN